MSYGQGSVVSLTRQDKVHAGLKTVGAPVERVQRRSEGTWKKKAKGSQ
jgi:hypothetical protein